MIQPVGKKIIVFPLPKKEESLPSGIVMPEAAMADLREARVVAVSSEVAHLYKEGDIILKPEKAGVAQLLDGEIHLWVDTDHNRNEVWGILTSEKQIQDRDDNL